MGPCNKESKESLDDHLTIGSSQEGQFIQIHRKLDGREVWRHTPNSIELELRRFLDSHIESIDTNLPTQPSVYVVSMWRLNVAFSLLNSIVGLAMNLITRMFFKYDVQARNKKVSIRISIDKNKVERWINLLKYPISKFFSIPALIPKSVYNRILRRILKMFLINPLDYHRLSYDLGVILSPDRVGIIWLSKDEKLSFISFSALLELYRNVERSLPPWKFSDIGDDFAESTTTEFIIKSKENDSQKDFLST